MGVEAVDDGLLRTAVLEVVLVEVETEDRQRETKQGLFGHRRYCWWTIRHVRLPGNC